MPTPEDLAKMREIAEKLQLKSAAAVEVEPDFELLTGKIYKATEDSAAFDLYYDGKHDWVIEDSPTGIPTGVRTKFKPGYVCIIKEKSGLALKGIELHGGVIDADYRDEWLVIARNPLWFNDVELDAIGNPISSRLRINPKWRPFVVKPGTRIAQFIMVKLPHVVMKAADGAQIVLSTDERKGGLGSTGLL